MNTCTPAKFLRPAATIIENNDGFLIEADMPGVSREGLQLTLEGDTFTILGKRSAAPASIRRLHSESAPLDYRRTFQLSTEISRERVEARFEQGVLRVFLPKTEAAKPRRIPIGG